MKIEKGRNFEYKMSPVMYQNILAEYKKQPKGTSSLQEYLCDYVNEQFGLLGTCVHVIVG